MSIRRAPHDLIQGRKRLRRSHLTNDLIGCFVVDGPDRIIDLTGYNTASPTGLTTFQPSSGVWTNTHDGIALRSTSATTTERYTLGLIDADINPMGMRATGRPGRTFCWWARRTSNTDFQRIFDKSSGGNALNGYAIGYGDAADNRGLYYWEAAAVRIRSTTASVLNAFEFWALTTYNGGTTTGNGFNQVYKDGEPVNTTVDSTPPHPMSSIDTNAALLQWNHVDTNRKFGGDFFGFAAWYRAMSESEIREVYEGKLFETVPIYSFAAPAAARIRTSVFRGAVISGGP